MNGPIVSGRHGGAPAETEYYCKAAIGPGRASRARMAPMFDMSLFGRLKFRHTRPTQPPFGPGRHYIGVSEERDYLLYVPESLDPTQPVKLLVLFHGAGGFPDKIMKHFTAHADREGFAILAGHSALVTWDIVIGGSGPDIERLDKALAIVADRLPLDPAHFAFGGFSDGCSYSLFVGVTNGDLCSHVIAMSGGFLSVFVQHGAPRIFLSHGYEDEQLPYERAGRAKAAKLLEAGYDVHFVPFHGLHTLTPEIAQQAVDFFLDRLPPLSPEELKTRLAPAPGAPAAASGDAPEAAS